MAEPREEQTEGGPRNCPECRRGDRSLEAQRARFEHHLSFARVHGEEKLKAHLIEVWGEEIARASYSATLSVAHRRLLIETWQMENLLARRKMSGDRT